MNHANRVKEFESFPCAARVVILAFLAMMSDRNKFEILNGEQACKPDSVRRADVAACAPWRSFL